MGLSEDMKQIAINGIDISKIKRDRELLKKDLITYLEDNLDRGMLPFKSGDEVSYDYKFAQGDVLAKFDKDHVSFVKVYENIVDYDRASAFIINVALFLGEEIIKDLDFH